MRSGMNVMETVALVLVHAPWSKGHGPLHMAAAAGNVKSCRILIRDFSLHVDAIGIDGATPLVFAIYGNESTDVVKLLLESGADPNRAYSNGPNVYLTNTPLKAAVWGRSKKAVELLIEAGAHVNAGLPENPLIAAATAGLTDIIKYLLKAGADANITDNNGRTPIEAAAIQGWRECVEVLLPVTDPLARVADWSIAGVIQHAKFASSLPQDPLHDHEDDFEAEGNAAFSRRDYVHALTLYTMAIEINPGDSTLYAKRSLCFLRTGHIVKALEDAETYTDIHPDLPDSVQGAGALDLVEEFGIAFEALNLN
ncbi:hypothetical protein QOZ80_6BG0473810 [Eleusine coracana subsp. coracana]|nr:hypothetical protein QOZ80_6BG0473810 [Eleusine coracana subsp. coracana]